MTDQSSGTPDEAPPTRFQLALRSFLGGVVLHGYLRLIRLTSRHSVEPPDAWDWLPNLRPVIVVSWHGQSNLAYISVRYYEETALLTSNHLDGRIAMALARSFKFQTIDGSGMSERQKHGTGGRSATCSRPSKPARRCS